MDEKNQTPIITFRNTRAETLRFRGAGVQHSACCRVEYFVHLLSPSLTFHIFWSPNSVVETSLCMLLILCQTAQKWAFHKYMPPVCLPSHFFYSLIRNLFLSAQNIAFSQVSATFVLPVPFFFSIP